MAMYTTNSSPLLVPAEVGELLVRPVIAEAVATQVASVVETSSKSDRIPVIAADPTAAWVAEGDEISPSDATLDEVTVTPSKVAGLTIISRELAEDTSPEAAQVVGDGLARDIARKLDQASFGNLAAPAPAGLGSLPTTAGNVQTVNAGSSYANLDPFAAALSAAETVGSTIGAFVTTPAVVLALSQLKQATASNVPLIQSDPTAANRRQILGLPLYVSAAVATGVVWGIPRDRVTVVIRDDATVESDRSVFFTSDRVAVKATMRVGFGFPHYAGLVRISTTA